jgi:hypothetical protein
MSAQGHNHAGNGSGGCCGGRKDAAPTLAELERQLHALWARVQEERARQAQTTEPAKKKSCCCG